MYPNEDIIPITYLGGTGGTFVYHFITNAKYNNKDLINLSPNGNAHAAAEKEIVSPMAGIFKPDQPKIDLILSQSLSSSVVKPCYVSVHILDLSLVTRYFKKSIRITYDNDDIDDLSYVMYGKWYIDDARHRLDQKTLTIPEFRLGFLGWRRKFKTENVPDILFISWKELFKGNIDEFINKLSTFTDINIDNFSKESLIHWRNRTQQCIDKYSRI
jgi:hypothetical protein